MPHKDGQIRIQIAGKIYDYGMNCTIRLAQSQDLDHLVGFNQSLAQEIRGKDVDLKILRQGVQAVLANPERGFYTIVEAAVEKESPIIAAALITFEWSDWNNRWVWWLQDVYVQPRYRKQGIFRKLYDHLKTQAQAANVCRLCLYVYEGNTAAQEAYRKLGMAPSESLLFEEPL
jgi:GNAT superfamily N-acetyltransferase